MLVSLESKSYPTHLNSVTKKHIHCTSYLASYFYFFAITQHFVCIINVLIRVPHLICSKYIVVCGKEVTMVVELIGIYISVPLYALGSVLLGATITASLFLFHVAVVPLLFKYSKFFRRNLVFCNFVQWPLHIDFDKPSKSGIDGGRNFYLEHQSEVDNCHIKLGVWHILPKSVYERLKGSFDSTGDDKLHQTMQEELTNSKTPIMFYCHGNSNSRATTHRILLYKFFQKMDFHTIAFDYRGYGDSSPVHPSEDGVVEDALVVYKWLLKATEPKESRERPPIFIWGHSLGTGISSTLLSRTNGILPMPRGLILEAPFNNLADEVRHHPLSVLVTWLPYYDTTFISPFRTHAEHIFCSDKRLAVIKTLPVLILHAKDDGVVPFRVGLKLYREILNSRSKKDAPVSLHVFEKSEDLGHKYICLGKDLDQVMGEFVKKHQ